MVNSTQVNVMTDSAKSHSAPCRSARTCHEYATRNSTAAPISGQSDNDCHRADVTVVSLTRSCHRHISASVTDVSSFLRSDDWRWRREAAPLLREAGADGRP